MLTAQESSIITESIENLQKVDKNAGQKYLEDLVPGIINFAVQLLLAALLYLVGKRVITFIRNLLRKSLEHRSVDIGVRQFLDSVSKYCLYFILWLTILTLFGITTASVIALLGSAGPAGQSCQFCRRGADSAVRAFSCGRLYYIRGNRA